MNILEFLRKQFAVSLKTLTKKADEYAQHVKPAQETKFGDYQANCAMPLRKELGGNPQAIAQKIIDALPDRSVFSEISIAGPGFINMRLSDEFLAAQLAKLPADERLGVELPQSPKTLVIDYSSPNVAKPMHVGHLRSTIIGDALARMHRSLGWNVHSDNHLGDWGTQFGMLIWGWRRVNDPSLPAPPAIEKLRQEFSVEKLGGEYQDVLEKLARIYPVVSKLCEDNPEIAKATRDETAKMHGGDQENLALWSRFMPLCLADIARIYDRLGIRFDHQLGESFYHPMLAETVAELKASGLATESDGAVCIFFPDPSGKVDDDGKPIQRFAPAIVQKADGAFTYATSDLACIRYRVREFDPEAIVYVVDDRQSLHFQQLFEAAQRWGYDKVRLIHVAFGKILGKDGKPYRTREGTVVGLEMLLDEAIGRAKAVVDEISGELPEEERKQIAEVVGIGAVKYADLSQNRTSDYVFDWDKMIALNGNTSAYLQMAYARNRSIFRKGEIDPAALMAQAPAVTLGHASERALAMMLLRYPESLQAGAEDFRPNVVTSYLYDLATTYSDFFRDCPVLKAETEELRDSRLALCELTARTIKRGLELLGIDTIERM